MKRIIQRGQIFKIKCVECHCIFSFEEEDVEKSGPIYDRCVKISCPQCGRLMYGWDIKNLLNQYQY